jgi:hypothetical protein
MNILHMFGEPGEVEKAAQYEVKPLTKGAKAFAAFHEDNPEVYTLLCRMARWLKDDKGLQKCGMKMLFERLRWLYLIQTKGGKYKLNNNYTSHYARLLMEQEPDLVGFFEVRALAHERKSDD